MAVPRSTCEAFDLRGWLEKAEQIGQLRRVENAEARLEIGAISELNSKRRGPALLFTKVPGYREDFGVLTSAMLNARTLGLTLGIDEELDNIGIVNRIASMLRKCESHASEYPMKWVDGGPVMENVLRDDDVDLTIFPTPIWHELDGGPFIGTGCVQIHQDPETGWVNVGTYRMQLLGRNLLGNYISPGHHGHIIRQKYWKAGKPAPVVVSFGHHPIFLLMGSSDVPAGVDELSWIGAIYGQPVPVIRGPVTGLPIPACAEIAVEGWAYPDKRMAEGPFGEFTGYYASGQKQEPYVEVKALYFRNQPILLGAPPNRPPNDFSYYFSVMRAAAVHESLRKAGIPGVRGVWVYEAGGGRMFLVTSISQQYAGHASQAAAIAATCQAGGLMARYSIVVDDDIDPSNPDDVIWALSTRSDPASDIDILRQSWSNPLDPMISDEAKARGQLWNSRALINACKPFDRLKTFPPVAESSPAMLKATREKWAWLFE
ncbi:UbiD family decarboxylase [Carboxydochorda subterranea]|uniref:UbiD family decarboxylase n=1 Tax=Carboxydichorda subterranea TaxID=3109565 RepID=A0ABZ1BXF7_9FIRM|nr:UbiD family decarboxylase [Limnochorda sp. L945t]WRP17484.1 UbiD family decarboxylase [Limnochorda sp. L945t]